MTTSVNTTSGGITSVAETLKLLGKQLRELGVTLSIWDHLGGNVGGFEPCCEFCQVI
jgi:hypothetical protein